MEYYVKSKNKYLIEFMVGIEENNKFTGIIIYFNKIYYVNQNKIYIGKNLKDLEKDNPAFKEIFEMYETLVETDINQFIFEKINNNIIYNSVLDDNEPNGYFYSVQNNENPFKNKVSNILKNQIESKQTFLANTKVDIDLHLELRKLNYLFLQSEELRASKDFALFLSNYNLEFKN